MHVLKNKSGATIIFIVIMLVLLFPLIMSSIIDLGNIYFISEQMKNSLNAATKSASTLVDWDRVPHGYLEIDTTRAESAAQDVLASNMGITLLTSHNGYKEGQSVQGEGVIRFHIAIYNNRHTGSLIPFPDLGTIPEAVTTDPIQVSVDRPTVFAVATVDYRLTPLFGGRTIRLTRHASAQLNQINEVATLPPPPIRPTAVLTMTPLSGLLPTTNIVFSSGLSVGNIALTEWQRNSDAITTTPPSGTFPVGTHTVRLRVHDVNGEVSEWVSTSFVVSPAPVAVITMTPSTNINTTTNVVFTHNATSGGLPIIATEWQRNADAITTTPPNGIFSAGAHIVRLRVQNSDGNWSAWVQTSFSVNNLVFTSIASGAFHSLALSNDGTVWAWGEGERGQLGNGTSTSSLTPVLVPNLTGITTIAAASLHSLAIRNDGTVWAWGRNAEGQLGDGTTTNRPSPVQVSGLTNIIRVAAGAGHSLALRSDGTVWAWGLNDFRQLGDGTTTNRLTPIQVSGLTGITNISTIGVHSLAIRNDGRVWGWGNNSTGQLGDSTTTQHFTPVQMTGLTNVISVAGGGNHSLMVRNDGIPFSTGHNWDGQLGNGTTTRSFIPIQVSNLTNITRVVGGWSHSLALRSDGTVWGWGFNSNASLGDGTTTTRLVPVQASGMTSVVGLAAGANHSLALRSDGSIWAWGGNSHGVLGDGTTTNRTTPVRVLTP